ncbi:MAG: DUF3187 family protein [Planctomycetota bacterium]|nr:DUF3187 family protein [Planctomycetota bacterium]MDW8372980.1 DUF3187 family protein [Planctomycetota bacterium]
MKTVIPRFLLLGLLCSACAAALAAEYRGWGPLRVPSQSLGQSLRLGLVPRAPTDLDAGQWEFFLGSTWVNVWSLQAEYSLDYEMLRHDAAVAYAPCEATAIEAGASTRTTFGGAMDRYIEFTHQIADLDGGRYLAPRNRALIRIVPTTTQPRVLLTDEELEGATQAFGYACIQRRLWSGTAWRPAVAIAVTAQTPLRNETIYEGGDLDLAADLIAAYRLWRVHSYAMINCTRFGAERVYGVRLHRHVWNALAAAELRLTAGTSLIVQYLYSQGVFPDYHVFSRASHELVAGFKGRVGEALVLEIGILENLFTFDNSPDFGVHAALRSRW